jgi:hypothetical protein
MHTNKKLVALTVVMVLAIGPAAIAAPNLSNKAAGRTGTTVVNTILSGVGVPSKTLGINGDFYIDTKNANLYGPKTNGVWKLTTSLRPLPTKASPTVPGATGSTGATGSAGASGLIGPRGLPGATGDRGATGAAGTNGLPGAAGTNGLPGAAGAAGIAGATGSVGPAGPAGSSGTVLGSQSSITFAEQLAGTAGSSTNSEAFGNFEAGKSYVVRVLISTFDVNKVAASYGIGLTVSSPSGGPGISASYVVSTGSVYSGSNKVTISIIADIVLNGISVTTPYALVATLTSGATSGASITANGSFTKIQVGAIG